ncbi:4-alpha-glucanotransferase [Bradyrhizobium sp.]|uniref:4-alpha-glucanotransferase n=1 Tax=Bradyrhizobium sp. TaxID=376 RepID=UPI00260B7BAE|nr:4-alpha-glucanotransferase [Bradyrhizobium sp.]
MDVYDRAKELGIQTEFVDGQGHRHVTDEIALKIILDALPERNPTRLLDHPVVIRTGETTRTELSPAAALPVSWKVTAGREVIAKGQADQRVIAWPANWQEGVYRLTLTDAASLSQEIPLLVSPPRAWAGEFDRGWMMAVQLYSIRSSRNWGIGDFTDLAALLELAAQFGADGVGLNPLHALFDDKPADCSPYAPNSRLFLNPLYIDAERIAEFEAGSEAHKAAARLREGHIVDYKGVAELKWRALRAAFEGFKTKPAGERKADFDAFRAEREPLLSRFACFEVLRHKFGVAWWEWPAEWRASDDAKCAELRRGEDAAEIEFVEFVQWTADRQLRDCRDLARRLGMKVGLYLDVAVGVQSGGFDAWNEQTAISRHLSVGAPPDPLNVAGQNWGLAGFNAAGLELQLFEPYRQMLRAAMRYAGAVRLDHVLGLKRLYLVPHGFAADEGAYVQMPFEALLAATAQQSMAHRCIVIGEDLGTVPEGFRDTMAEWGIWSYQVVMFERDDRGAFHDPDRYLPNALVTFNTHDLSTYAGWRSFGDLKIKRSLGIDPGESDDARWHALTMLDEVLRHHQIEGNDLYSIAAFLSKTRSRLMAISLEDFLGVIDQPNIPGTVNEHPNWRQRLPLAVSDIAHEVDIEALKSATQERALAKS